MRTVVIPRVRVRAWHGGPVLVPTFKTKDLVEALKANYESEACVVMYGSQDARLPRLGKAALSHFMLHPESTPTLQSILVDIDYPNHVEPPPDWHLSVLELCPFPCGWYRTPNGMRLVMQPKKPVPLKCANDYLKQVYAKLEAAGIEPDRSKDTWYSLFKAPHALGRSLPMDLSGLKPISFHPKKMEAEDPMSLGPIVEGSAPADIDLKRSDLKGIPARLGNDLYEGRISAPTGDRHRVFLGLCYRLVTDLETVDPSVPYRLLHKSWAKYNDKTSDELFRMCQWVCAGYSGQLVAEREERLSLMDEVADAMGVPVDQARRRLILDTGKQQYVFCQEELDWVHMVPNPRLLPGALDRHCSLLIDTEQEMTDIIRDHASPVHKLVYSYTESGFRDGTLYRKVCPQDPTLEAEFHPDIQRWLEAFLGDHVEQGLDWLAALPDLDKPVCALYVHGPHSIGKGLFARGIARLWNREGAIVEYAELIADFNQGLTQSPIILADEKVPVDAKSANDSSVFRKAIGNTAIYINAKFMTPAVLMGYPRLLITANNEDAMQIREDLTMEDIEAVRIRIGYVKTDGEAARVLADIAGDQPIRDVTDRWITEGCIAKHVLWLHENREFKAGDRFLVEGWESSLTEDLPTNSGKSGTVAECIAMSVLNNDASDAVRWFEGKIYVNKVQFAAEWEHTHHEKTPTSSTLTKALKALAHGNGKTLRTNAGKQLRYWEIDATVIERVATRRNLCEAGEILRMTEGQGSEKEVVFTMQELA